MIFKNAPHLMISLALIGTLAGCSSETTESDTHAGKPDSMLAVELSKPKKVTAVDVAIEKEIAKEDTSLIKERFKNAYNSNREENVVSVGAELLSRNPDDLNTLKAMGLFYIKQGKPGIAKVYFTRVLDKEPKSSNVNNALGVIAMQEGKEQEAQRFFKIALQGDSDNTEANFNLGSYYLKYQDYEKAEKFLEPAYENNRKDASIANNYAIALRGVGKIDKALDVYKGIESKGTKVPSLLNQAILLAEYKKDYKEAREVLNKIRFITTDPMILKKVNEIAKIVDQK